mmetsp:Transcript_18923/g.41443  ORF Transcript_18923/g.41443 Transcript_18923/m.41443 type:complete len:377 (-) Transcript_18923:16-1146(-)
MAYPLSMRALCFALVGGMMLIEGADLELSTRHDSFSFLVLGDWGMGTNVQKSVAKSMNEKAEAAGDALFVLNVGDNFYKSELSEEGEKQGGVDGVEDPLWSEYFENMYSHKHIEDLPFVSVLGNHDYMGDYKAQLAYARDSKRFLMPKRNFVTRINNEDTGAVLATFVHIDTSPFVGMYDAFPENSIMADNLQAVSKEDGDTLTWLRDSLSGISKEGGYIFVVGHHPVRSNFFSDSSEKQVIMEKNMEKLRSILEEYNIDAYFSGHVHALEYVDINGINYILSGGGGESKEYPRRSDAQGWFKKSSGFAAVSLDARSGAAKVEYLDHNGEKLHSLTFVSKSKQGETNRSDGNSLVERIGLRLLPARKFLRSLYNYE